MTIVIELNSEEEARLETVSRLHGADPATYAKLLITQNLNPIPTIDSFDAMMERIARPLKPIPHEKQTREYIYED